MIKSLFNPKLLLGLAFIIAAGYLVSKFPDESVLIIGIAAIIIIGIWIYQAYVKPELLTNY